VGCLEDKESSQGQGMGKDPKAETYKKKEEKRKQLKYLK